MTKILFFKKPHSKNSVKNKNPAHQKNYTLLYMQIFSKTNTAQKIFSPHCNKNYDFSFTFLLNLRNFTHHRAKIRSNLANFCQIFAKVQNFHTPKAPFYRHFKKIPTNFAKIYKFKFSLSKNLYFRAIMTLLNSNYYEGEPMK